MTYCQRLKFIVLSWDAIVEALVEYDYEKSDPEAAHLVSYTFYYCSERHYLCPSVNI